MFIKEQESVQSEGTLDEDHAFNPNSLHEDAEKGDDEELPPPAKKQKKTDTIQMGNIVDSKKVGKHP